ncbi:MAG: hypothetical protein AABX88_03040 [Nanoarchaeota archaeon]
MDEGRAKKYGRNLGILVNYTIKISMCESQREDYRELCKIQKIAKFS